MWEVTPVVSSSCIFFDALPPECVSSVARVISWLLGCLIGLTSKKDEDTMRWIFKGLGDRRDLGAAAVELAVLLPLLLLLGLGTMEFAIMLYDQHVITNASREGARYGIAWDTPRNDPDIDTEQIIKGITGQYCTEHLISFGSDSNQEPIVHVPSLCVAAGDNLRVQVTYDYDFLGFSNIVKLFRGSSSGSIHLSAYTEMVCQ